MPLPNGQAPMSVQQLILQLAQSNPDALAAMLASKGAQPPIAPLGPGASMAAAGAEPPAMAPSAAPPAPAPAPDLGAAMAGIAPPTMAGPVDGAPPPPGASVAGSGGSFNPQIAQLMQALMAQQKAAPPMSLGQSILGR